jgi:hypothetical protein
MHAGTRAHTHTHSHIHNFDNKAVAHNFSNGWNLPTSMHINFCIWHSIVKSAIQPLKHGGNLHVLFVWQLNNLKFCQSFVWYLEEEAITIQYAFLQPAAVSGG